MIEIRGRLYASQAFSGSVNKKCQYLCDSTFHCNVDTRCKKQSPKAIVEDLIAL